MILRKTLIEVAVWLKERNSPCRYADYYNVFKKNHPEKLSALLRWDWQRRMREMREEGVFMPVKGQFLINNTLFERIKG